MNKIFCMMLWVVANANAQYVEYPNFIERLYSKSDYDSIKFQNYAESCGVDGFADDKSRLNKILPGSYKTCLSLKEVDGNQVFGIYLVNNLAADYSPHLRAFSGWEGRPSLVNVNYARDLSHKHFDTRGDQIGKMLTDLKCTVIDLYDARMAVDEMGYLSKIDTLKILALPSMGMEFDKVFFFPVQIEALVVRNCKLTNHFFNALIKMTALKVLIIENCTTSLQYPRSVEWYYERDRSWLDLPRVFGEGLPSLEHMSIKRSDPNIFNYMIPEKWDSLKSLELDFFVGSEDGISTIFLNKESLRKTFPVLKSFVARATPYQYSLLNTCVEGLNETKLELEIAPYKQKVFSKNE